MRVYPTPKGSVTPFGYRRVATKDRRQRFEHVLVWEQHQGRELHHINGDKLDNRIADSTLRCNADGDHSRSTSWGVR
jgi:hypothetical protein